MAADIKAAIERMLDSWRSDCDPSHAVCEVGENCSWVDYELAERIKRLVKEACDEAYAECENELREELLCAKELSNSTPLKPKPLLVGTLVALTRRIAARRKERIDGL